ncbi:hypothetical protein MMC29_006354 [Sticta canariensis]|nr:hypothetical protein [Sticta canariensis]
MSSELLKSVPFPIPSIDRPFAAELWPLFDRLYTAVVGYCPTDFRFVPGETPISTLKATVLLLSTYYITVFAGREVMRNRAPLNLNRLFMVHNLYLTIISGTLLALFIEQLLPTIWRKGMFFAICNHKGGWTDQLVALYYLNYLTKYIELIDTIFMVLKKKPLTFLHTYHHGATALLCYTQLIGITAVSWVPITLNLLVHVVMYWYYFQSARGVRVWWKKWITRLQIVQFVIDLGFVYFASYTYFSSTYFPDLPSYGKCAGEEFAAFAGMGILSSYLLLFISFYFATYKKTGQGGRKRSGTATRAAIGMSKMEIPSVNSAKGVMSHTNGSLANSHIRANGSANASGVNSNGTVARPRKA